MNQIETDGAMSAENEATLADFITNYVSTFS